MIDEHRPDEPDAPGTAAGVLRLERDIRTGGSAELAVVATPSLDDIAAALGALDQRRHTRMTLVGGAGTYLTVGGGRGRYHVYVGAFDSDDRVVLQSPGDTGPQDLVVDGSPRRYAPADVVDLEAAADAVLAFARSGRLHPDLPWRAG